MIPVNYSVGKQLAIEWGQYTWDYTCVLHRSVKDAMLPQKLRTEYIQKKRNAGLVNWNDNMMTKKTMRDKMTFLYLSCIARHDRESKGLIGENNLSW